MTDRIKVDFHLHTLHSPDSFTPIPDILRRMKKIGLGKVAITDHNTLRGALEAHALDPQHVIIGEEIETGNGEILGYFMKEEIPAGLPPMEVIARLRAQGAFISVSHPFDRRRVRWSLEELRTLAPLVDAFEVFNGRCYDPLSNQQAAQFCLENGLLGTAGSDSHALFELGRSFVELSPFEDAESLRGALAEATINEFSSSPLVSLVSTAAGLLPRNPRKDGNPWKDKP